MDDDGDDGSASDDDENERMLQQLASQGKVTEDQRDELLVRLVVVSLFYVELQTSRSTEVSVQR